MKKILCFALAAALFATGCDKNENSGNDDNGYRYLTLTFEGSEWTDKVDSPQYNGPKLYGDGYSWYDSTTDLYSELNDGYGGRKFWNGGCAVSNYFSRDLEANKTFDSQLTVYADDAYSGNNCIVCNGYASSWGDSRPSMEFKYGSGYIVSMYVCNTAYTYYTAKSVAQNPALEWMKIVATGYTKDDNGDEVEGESVELYLYRNGNFTFDGWKEWNLSELGEIWKVKFDMQWNGGADALLIPAYFAIDDITVYKK